MDIAPLDQRAAIRLGRISNLDGTPGLAGAGEARSGSASRLAQGVSPEQLAGNTSLTEEQKIAEGARLFEAMLLRQILQETQKTVIQSKFADNSATAGIYRDMITNQLAESISQSGSLGLARTLEHQLGSQLLRTASPNPESAASSQPSAACSQPALKTTDSGLLTTDFRP